MSGYLVVGISGLKLTIAEEKLLRHPAVAGVILFDRNYDSISQLTALTKSINETRYDLFTCVDQEGGRVQRFQEEFTILPALGDLGRQYALYEQRTKTLAKSAGIVMAYELARCGVDFSFSPVLDLDRGLNQVIGKRSFNANPRVVASLARAFAQGVHQYGMPVVGKHFPGHGGVSEDTHHEAAIDAREMSEIEQDMLPYTELMEYDLLDGIMSAHIIYSKVDEKLATFSKTWLQDILRERLGYRGDIFSDCLTMAAARHGDDLAAAGLAALNAGCTYLLICNELDKIPSTIKQIEAAYDREARAPYQFKWHRDRELELSEPEYLNAKRLLEKT